MKLILFHFAFLCVLMGERSNMPGNEELKFRGNVMGLCCESSYLLEVIVEAKHSQDHGGINKD